MARIKESIVPPGGWNYKQPHKDQEVTILGNTLTDLLRRVVIFRLENSIEVGDVYEDVEEYLCKFPSQCNQKHKEIEKFDPFTATFSRWIDKILAWARFVQQRNVAYVNEEVFEARFRYCRKCQYAETWRNQCPPCVENAKTIFLLVTRGKIDHHQLGCHKYNFDCATACRLEERFLPEKGDVVQECWRNRA